MNGNRGVLSPSEPRPHYRRPNRLRQWGVLALTGGAALGVACGGSSGGGDSNVSATEWVETDGASGRINMDDVRDAYRESFSNGNFDVAKFERRVNEIYTGDNLIIVQAEQKGNDTVEVSGWEDLNKNKTLDQNEDDKLFTVTQELKENGTTTVQGYHANSYYHHSSPFGGFLPGFLLGQFLGGGRTTYVTPRDRYDSNAGYISSYRGTPAYASQQSRNQSYGSSVPSRFGSDSTTKAVSPARSSYQSRQVSSGGFRNSGSSSRSISTGGAKGPVGGGATGGGGIFRL